MRPCVDPLEAPSKKADTVDIHAKTDSAHQAAFNADLCAMALTSQCKRGAHLFCVNQLWSVSPGIPMNPSAMSRLPSFYLEAPGPVRMELVIADDGPKLQAVIAQGRTAMRGAGRDQNR